MDTNTHAATAVRERLFTPREAADYLQLHYRTVRRRCKMWRDSKGALGIRHVLVQSTGGQRYEIRIPESALAEQLYDPSEVMR